MTQAAAATTEEVEKAGIIRNEIWHRIQALQWPANQPSNDSLACRQLRGFDGYYVGVFDGNNGWQLADYCGKKLHLYLEKNLDGAKTEKQIVQALNKAFTQVE